MSHDKDLDKQIAEVIARDQSLTDEQRAPVDTPDPDDTKLECEAPHA